MITPHAIELLQRTIAEDTSTAFLRDGEKTYIRYDSLRISREVVEHKKGIFRTEKYSTHIYIIEFLLKGKPVTQHEVKNVYFDDGDTLTLTGLNGVFEITIKGIS